MENDGDKKARRSAYAQRMARLITIHRMRQSSQRLSASQIAAAIGVSRRTVFRDLAALKQIYDQLGSDRFDHCEPLNGPRFDDPGEKPASESWYCPPMHVSGIH